MCPRVKWGNRTVIRLRTVITGIQFLCHWNHVTCAVWWGTTFNAKITTNVNLLIWIGEIFVFLILLMPSNFIQMTAQYELNYQTLAVNSSKMLLYNDASIDFILKVLQCVFRFILFVCSINNFDLLLHFLRPKFIQLFWLFERGKYSTCSMEAHNELIWIDWNLLAMWNDYKLIPNIYRCD